MRPRWPALMLVLPACASAGATPDDGAAAWSLDLADARGDVRLEPPDQPGLDRGTFDVEHVTLARRGDDWRLEVTFASPVPTLDEVRAARDRVITILPQTIDVYLDLVPDAGWLDALPGRGFRVAASEAWDRVLVASSLDDLGHDGLVHAQSFRAQGRRIVATFPARAIPVRPRGALVVVLATSTSGTGKVRRVARGGDCHVWNDERCTLAPIGDGRGEPPVLDAVGVEVQAERPLALVYPDGARPTPSTTPVVFQRGTLIGAAPVDASLAKGRLATVFDAHGAAIGTAIVLSVVGDTASLEMMTEVAGAHAVVFASVEATP